MLTLRGLQRKVKRLTRAIREPTTNRHLEHEEPRALPIVVRKVGGLRLQICEDGLNRRAELSGLAAAFPASTGMLTFRKNRIGDLLTVSVSGSFWLTLGRRTASNASPWAAGARSGGCAPDGEKKRQLPDCNDPAGDPPDPNHGPRHLPAARLGIHARATL